MYSFWKRFAITKINDGGYVPTGKITFNQEDKDSTNSFNEGIFRAPLEGTYLFQFNGYVNNANSAWIHVDLNGAIERYIYDVGSGAREVTDYFVLSLEKDDELFLENQYASTFYTDSTLVMTFMAQRLAD